MSEQRFRLDYVEDDAIFIVEDDDIVYPIRNDTIKEYELQSIVDKLNEQQATIEQLQDLCGKSDGENMKLRIENKRLQKELNDCEKFRYTVFKRMGDVLDE